MLHQRARRRQRRRRSLAETIPWTFAPCGPRMMDVSTLTESSTTGAAAAPARRPLLGLLAQRDFGPYFVGNTLSNTGTFCQNIALSLLVYRLTDSSLWVGIVNFAQFAAVLLLAPWAGAAADRFDRKRLLAATQVAALALSGALALLSLQGAASLGSVCSLA